MKEITIRANGIISGLFDYKVRVKPKQNGWDIWFQRNGRWVKKTRGNSFLRAETLDDVINQCLSCGDYCLGKTLISIIEVRQ